MGNFRFNHRHVCGCSSFLHTDDSHQQIFPKVPEAPHGRGCFPWSSSCSSRLIGFCGLAVDDSRKLRKLPDGQVSVHHQRSDISCGIHRYKEVQDQSHSDDRALRSGGVDMLLGEILKKQPFAIIVKQKVVL